eukprot:m.476917 g.476917  ORF g.476917 m.476917 type:complete len:263 (+) comp20699_c0_seq1:230-1018(+)
MASPQKEPVDPEVQKERRKKWAEMAAADVDTQAKEFLLSFIMEFKGRSEEVLDIAEEFKSYLRNDGDVDLEEDLAHLFLERRGDARTVVELREALSVIDYDRNNRVCFLEYILFENDKTVDDLFDARDKGLPPEELIKALEEAIAQYHATLAEGKAEVDKRAELELLAEGFGVAAMKARAELAQMRARGFTSAHNYKEIRAKYTTKKKEKELREADKSEALRKAKAEEDARLEAEAKRKAQADAEERAARRARLKARASAFE